MSDTVCLIDYGSGNIRSVAKALERAASDAGTRQTILVSSTYQDVLKSKRLVLPGVGAFAACKQGLESLTGLKAALEDRVRGDGVPFLGICVGLQLMAEHGLEHGVHEGLGWLAGEVGALTPATSDQKIPHMGWNGLHQLRPHPVLEGVEDGTEFYFVHSYAFQKADENEVLGRCDYAGGFPAMLGRANMVGTQFHPEKSQAAGLRLLANFLRWTP